MGFHNCCVIYYLSQGSAVFYHDKNTDSPVPVRIKAERVKT